MAERVEIDMAGRMMITLTVGDSAALAYLARDWGISLDEALRRLIGRAEMALGNNARAGHGDNVVPFKSAGSCTHV